MSMSDPLADMFTRIINGQAARKVEVHLPSSNLKFAVSQVLKDEGYIEDTKVVITDNKAQILITLKYYKGDPVISQIKRISKPGRRIYKNKNDIPLVLGGLGISILSTPTGVMADRDARKCGHGGEILCLVS